MKNTFVLICIVLLCACGSGPARTSEEPTSGAGKRSIMPEKEWSMFQNAASGLLGKWESVQDSGRTVFNEQWQRTDDKSFSGIGYVMSGPDTVFVEHLSLHWDSLPTYTVRTPSQNGNEEVHFTWRKGCCDDGGLVFENPKHDWPQTIAYTRTASGWSAVVSGKDKGVDREARFDFVPRKDTLTVE